MWVLRSSPCGVVLGLIMFFSVQALLPAALHADDASPATKDLTPKVRQAVRRGLEYVEREGVAWIKERKCVSCHQVPSMIWSVNASRQHELWKDDAKIAEWTKWSLRWQNWNQPDQKDVQKVVMPANVDTMTSLILSTPKDLRDENIRAKFTDYLNELLQVQNKDGSWTAGGQLPLQTRSKAETQQVTTMWALLALDAVDDGREEIGTSRTRALAWLAKPATAGDGPKGNSSKVKGAQTKDNSAKLKGTIGKNANSKGPKTSGEAESTEWWVTRWLIEYRLGDRKKAAGLLKKLLGKQHDDGGWGWLTGDKSDAFGTGLALYALGQSGMTSSDAAVARAQGYLLDTQEKDGSWQVPTTLKRRRGRVLPTSQHWGTAWAIIGLLETTGPK